MKASDIAPHETKFDQTLVDGSGKRFILGDSTRARRSIAAPTTGFYKAEVKPKTAICLHFTCGYLGGDVATLTQQDYMVSVPYVLGRNGVMYQLFGEEYWSYHLGASCIGNNLFQSQRTIAIEISNIGPLVSDIKSGCMKTIYGDVYCKIGEMQYYTALEKQYRGYQYYSTFTDAQYCELKELIDTLCFSYKIPKVLLDESIRYNIFKTPEESRAFSGICSHANFRADGKVDIGPAFDWNRIV